MPLEFAHDAGALGRIVDLGIARVDVVRQRAVLEHPLGGILEGRQHVLGGDAEPARKALDEAMRVIGRDGAGCLLGLFRRDQRGVLPDRLAVGSPEQRERPARQRLAGIPFALAVMQQSARGELVGQSPDQLVGQDALGRPERRRVPFRRLIVIDRDEGRLAAHRQADVGLRQIGIDPFAQRIERDPGLVGKRVRDARLLVDARDLHLEGELDLRRLDAAADRRRRAIVRRCGERNMALPGQQPGCGIHSDPAGARQVDFGPGVQIGEILRRAGRPVERLEVGGQLDQIAGHETRCEAEMPQHLNQQPGRVAA